MQARETYLPLPYPRMLTLRLPAALQFPSLQTSPAKIAPHNNRFDSVELRFRQPMSGFWEQIQRAPPFVLGKSNVHKNYFSLGCLTGALMV